MKIRKHGKNILLFLTVVLLFLLPLSLMQGKSKNKVDRLLKQKKFPAVENYCGRLKGKKQKECYKQLADAYFTEGNYQKAAECCEKCGYREGFNRIADTLLQIKKYDLALEYFKKAAPSALRATGYEQLADHYNRRGDLARAKEKYNDAVRDYEFLLKNFNYEWKKEYFKPLKRCIEKHDQFEKSTREKEEQALLEKILKGVGDYCTRMKNSVIHFFCNEEIIEINDFTRQTERKIKYQLDGRMDTRKIPQVQTEKKYLYEYQLIQEGDKFSEMRTLLKKNNVEMHVPGAQLETSPYRYEKLIFGPFALLSPFWQQHYWYKLIKEDVLWGEEAAVIEAIPLGSSRLNPLFGKIWISKKDFSVLKIQWNPKSMDTSGQIKQRSLVYDAAPKVIFFEEFKVKKNGIRFPSKYYLQESYVNKKGKTFVRSKLDVMLKDFRFFVVGSEVINAEPDIPPKVGEEGVRPE